MRYRQPHSVFLNKPSPDAKLWRYLKIEYLVDMMTSNSLHFTRLDRFRKDDHFEGHWPILDIEWLKKAPAFRFLLYPQYNFILNTAVSCWHENEDESVLMWKNYANAGVVIQTTFKKLQEQIDNYWERTGIGQPGATSFVDMARVNYIDYLKDFFIVEGELMPNGLVPFMLKDKAYKDEREVRIMVTPWDMVPDSGLKVPVDPNILIESVSITPFCSPEYEKKIYEALVRVDLMEKLNHSRLSKKALHVS